VIPGAHIAIRQQVSSTRAGNQGRERAAYRGHAGGMRNLPQVMLSC
jgi:hypothetical protein